MTEQQYERAEQIADSLREDGVAMSSWPDNIPDITWEEYYGVDKDD